MPNITMKDVADRAQVSSATVSAVLTKKKFVSEDLTRRVLQAVDELGYRPNSVARSLRVSKTHTIGVLIHSMSSPFFPAVLNGIDEVLSAAGYSMLIAGTKLSLKSEASLLSVMQDKQVDGLLIVPVGLESTSLLGSINRQDVPVVTLHNDVCQGRLDAVVWDDYSGSFAAVQHLISLGKRRIAVLKSGLPSRADTTSSQIGGMPRIRGYEDALKQAGIALDPSLYLMGGTDADGTATSVATNVTLQILQQSNPPDAIFVTDAMAGLGVLNGVKLAGKQIPADVAVVSYDDYPWAPMLSPSLSVVSRNGTILGSTAAEFLLRRISQEDITPPEKIMLPTELIVRESSKGEENLV